VELARVGQRSSGLGDRSERLGGDTQLLGANVYQPVLFAGQYKDTETTAYLNDTVSVHRPGLVLDGLRTYDPFSGSYLQVDPRGRETSSAYGYRNSNPIKIGNGGNVIDFSRIEQRVQGCRGLPSFRMPASELVVLVDTCKSTGIPSWDDIIVADDGLGLSDPSIVYLINNGAFWSTGFGVNPSGESAACQRCQLGCELAAVYACALTEESDPKKQEQCKNDGYVKCAGKCPCKQL
jgi:RHS repeat-associated protein